jgi:hypothetical protein
VLAPVARSFLIPDNHNGRPTMSSIAVAHKVSAMGGASIACLNSTLPMSAMPVVQMALRAVPSGKR